MPSKKKKKSNKKLLSNILKICFTAFLVLMALFAIYVVMVIASASMEDMDVDKYIMNYSGQIYYKNNETGNYENLDSVYSSENRLWVPITKMPEHLKDAAVAIEDERFYQHNGIDLKRTFGAVVHYIIDKDSAYGGSTITQQLVKNLTGQKDRKVSRKIKEIWNSFRLERKMSKDQILELYLFGNMLFAVKFCTHRIVYDAHVRINRRAIGLYSIGQKCRVFDSFCRAFAYVVAYYINQSARSLFIQKTRGINTLGKHLYIACFIVPLTNVKAFAVFVINDGEFFLILA